jgi:hypothetical protein
VVVNQELAFITTQRPVLSREMDRLSGLALAAGKDFNDELTFILNRAEISLNLLPPDHPASHELIEMQHSAIRCAEITRCLLLLTLRARDVRACATVKTSDAHTGD